MATPGGSPPYQSQIESVALALPAGQQEDFRSMMRAVFSNLVAQAPGGNLLKPGGARSGSSNPPSGVGFSVAGSNGTYTLTVTNPSGGQGGILWHEISYSPVKSFSTGVVTLPPTAGTSLTLPDPGTAYFFRIRSSFDLNTWSSYQLATQSSTSSGLQTSAATSDAVALNQTNFAVVTSAAVGSTAEVSVQGPSAPLTNPVRIKGPVQSTLPGATIYGVAPSSQQFVGYNDGYVLRSTLAGVLSSDTVIPVGAVNVVNTTPPTLPTVKAVLGAGGAIVAYNVTAGGAGASADYIFTITDPGGPGAGATTGAQTFSAGVLTSVAPGNPGSGYDVNTVVTPSGGQFPGESGGGTSAGGNGGRLTAV